MREIVVLMKYVLSIVSHIFITVHKSIRRFTSFRFLNTLWLNFWLNLIYLYIFLFHLGFRIYLYSSSTNKLTIVNNLFMVIITFKCNETLIPLVLYTRYYFMLIVRRRCTLYTCASFHYT